MNSIKKYEEWTPGMVEEAADESNKANQSKWFTPVVGMNLIRFLPGLPGHQPFCPSYEHVLEQALFGGQRDERFPCPRKLAKLPCPACTLSMKWSQSANPADQSRAEGLVPKRRVMANIHLRANPESLCKIYAFSDSMHKTLLSWALPKPKGMGCDFTHPIRGVDVMLTRTGTGLATRYTASLSPEGRTLLADDPGDVDAILDARADLAKFTKFPTAAEIQDMLGGQQVDWRRGAATRTLPAASGLTASDLIDGDHVVED